MVRLVSPKSLRCCRRRQNVVRIEYFKLHKGKCNNCFERYDEYKYYNYSNPIFTSSAGHFTQLVWKDTTKLGCARCGGYSSLSNYWETYVVCNYKVRGNFAGQFTQNVLPRTKTPNNATIDQISKSTPP